MIYLQLFWSFIQVGLFSIGGGYAAMPLIQSQVVELHPWLTMNEFTDLITIAEMTPGPIAVNSATFVGIRIAGFPGAVIATFGCILPSCLIVSMLAFIYYRYKGVAVYSWKSASSGCGADCLSGNLHSDAGDVSGSGYGSGKCKLVWDVAVCCRVFCSSKV